MMNLVPQTNFDFLKNRRVFFAISLLLIVASFAVVFVKGLNLGIDFKGGTMMQVKFNSAVEIAQLRDAVDFFNPEIQSYGNNLFAIKIKGAQENVNEVKTSLETALTKAGYSYTVEATDYVGPTVGNDLAKRAIMALVLSLVFMVIYIAFRFQNIVWGTAGVIALVHDAVIMVGLFALLGREFDLVIVAALLTAVGYSINDNIVIFDRMRENIKLHPKMDFYALVNQSLNETLSRTVITGSTVLVAVVILFFLGGEVLKNFSLIMIIGVIVGTLSTLFLATPLVYEWAKNSADFAHEMSEKKVHDKQIANEVKKKNKKAKK